MKQKILISQIKYFTYLQAKKNKNFIGKVNTLVVICAMTPPFTPSSQMDEIEPEFIAFNYIEIIPILILSIISINILTRLTVV